MNMRKVFPAFLALVCILCSCSLFALGASAEGERLVYATTSASVQQGNYGYLYVYLDDLTDLSALNISVYYDTDKIKVSSATNQVSATVYDISTASGCVNASYILDGNGGAKKTNLFYVYYQVLSTAEVGDTYFDIVVTEAYDSALNDVPFSGSRCTFAVTEKAVTSSCSITSSSTVSTSVGEEFELTYKLSTYSIASGAMTVQYDPELFEVVSVTNGAFLTDKIVDVNTDLDGAVSLSFVGSAYKSKYDVITVRFKTIQNVSETSEIKLAVSELYNLDFVPYSCSGYTTKATVAFDETYTLDAPSMRVNAVYSPSTKKVTATVKLEKDSMLGAGDFTLHFDKDLLAYESAEMGFAPTYFIINDTNVANGVLKFSVVSTEDITDEQTVLTVTFTAKSDVEQSTEIRISGEVLTDSLTNPIMLNFVNGSATISDYDPAADIDGDGVVNIKDVLIVLHSVLNGSALENADLNGDGKVTLLDVLRVLKAATT